MGTTRFIRILQFRFTQNGNDRHLFVWDRRPVPTSGRNWQLLRRQSHLQRRISRASFPLRNSWFQLLLKAKSKSDGVVGMWKGRWWRADEFLQRGMRQMFHPRSSRKGELFWRRNQWAKYFYTGPGSPGIHSKSHPVSSPADCSSTTNGTEPTTTPGPTTSTTQKITTTSTEKTTTPTTTTSTTNRPVTFSCAGKANGNYPNPASRCSSTFYTCSNGNAYLFVSYPALKSKISWPNSLFVCRTALLIWFIGRKLASAIILRTWPDAFTNSWKIVILNSNVVD